MDAMSPRPTDAEVRDACTAWQGGRDGGSSPIRAAARVLTGVDHYFSADFITDLEQTAASNPQTLSRARALLGALGSSPLLDATEWGERTGFPTSWAGRGISSGPQDDQISTVLGTGLITMPLWGLSLQRDVAESFGTRFLFELEGPFPAIPAWQMSDFKHDERELISGGQYEVTTIDHSNAGTIVGLRYLRMVQP